MLVLKRNGETVERVQPGGWFKLPDGSSCSPAYAGWANEDGYSIEAEADPVLPPPTIEAQRATAVLPRLEFCLALLRLDILPMAECKAAARGEWPATFAGFISGMSAADAAEAEIRWASAVQIFYTNPLLQGLAMAKAGGDAVAAAAVLDAIFEIL